MTTVTLRLMAASGAFALAFGFFGTTSGAEVELKDTQAVLFSEWKLAAKPAARNSGAVEIARPPKGQAYCRVSFLVRITWDEATMDWSIKRPQIRLEANGRELENFAKIESFGLIFYGGAATMEIARVYRDYSWKDKPPSLHRFHVVYLVPENTKELALKFNGQDSKIPCVGPPQPYDPAQLLDVKVVASKVEESTPGGPSYAPEDAPKTERRNPHGSLLCVKLTLSRPTPRKEFDAGFDPFEGLSADDFCLAFGKGGRGLCVGSRSGDGSLDGSWYLPFKFDGPPADEHEVELCFLIPAKLSAFEVLCQGKSLAKGVVGK